MVQTQSSHAPPPSSHAPPLLPVDRDWLIKCIQKYHPSYDRSKEPIYTLAPMVDQSDLPFRLLTRQYGCHLAFTPMIHAKLFCTSPMYRQKFQLQTTSSTQQQRDRPLIAQLCGSDPDAVLQTALQLQEYCDGIDINCGCPQAIAKRGKYGAYLLEQEDILLHLVRTLVPHLSVPLSIKVRLLPGPLERSLALYQKLVDAGAHMLTIHGRTRFHKGPSTGAANWKAIRAAVELLGHRIPIIANGSIGSKQDAIQCWKETGCDGVMSSEAILEYPALFYNDDIKIGRLRLAREYMALANEFPPDQGGQGSGLKCIRVHLHRIMDADLQTDAELRTQIVNAEKIEQLVAALDRIEAIHKEQGHEVQKEKLTWYTRHRDLVRDENGVTLRKVDHKSQSEATIRMADIADDAADCFACMFDDENDDQDDTNCAISTVA